MQINSKHHEHYWMTLLSRKVARYSFPWKVAGTNSRQSLEAFIPVEATAAIIKICRTSDTAILTYFTTALSVVLGKYLGRNDVGFRSSMEGRELVQVIDLSVEESYEALLKRVGSRVSESLDHSGIALSELVEKVSVRNEHHDVRAVNQVHFHYDKSAGVSDSQEAELQISLCQVHEQFRLQAFFNSSPVLRPIFESFMESLMAVAIQTPRLLNTAFRDLDVLSEGQHHLLNTFAFGPRYASAPVSYLEFWQRSVADFSDARAVVHGDAALTYRALDERAGRIARVLREQGVKRGDVVAVLLDRSIDLVPAWLGVLKAGAAFLSIDPAYPDERIHYLLSNSEAEIVILEPGYANRIPKGPKAIYIQDIPVDSVPFEDSEVDSGDLAYVIYTSGTTGRPNGVAVEHRALVNLCQWHNRYYEVTPQDICTKYAGLGFDASVWEIFPPLLAGATLYIVEDNIRHSVIDLNSNLIRHGVTISFLPTQLGEQFMALENPVLKKLLVGGDKLRRLKEKTGYAIYNNYGPTENAVVSTACRVDQAVDNIPIGKPIDNTFIYILSADGQHQPLGVPGELHIGGQSLARGYVLNENLTQKKFITGIQGERLYRTGDMARWLPDGNIEFLGRCDMQIKIRGHRIEPEEIEKAILSCASVHDVAVVAKEGAGGTQYLCAYYTGDVEITKEHFDTSLSKCLPEYMIPQRYVMLGEMPVTSNGKTDRNLLVQREEAQVTSRSAAPDNDVQKNIANVWQEVLGVKPIGLDDNFFVLGGDSIMAMQIESRLMNYGYRWGNRGIFSNPTVRLMAEQVSVGHSRSVVVPVSGAVPLTPIQAAFFGNRAIVKKHHYNQSVLLSLNNHVTLHTVQQVFEALVRHHDALRTTFTVRDGEVSQYNREESAANTVSVVEHVLGDEADVAVICELAQRSMDLNEGPLIKVILFQLPSKSAVTIMIHHLVVDAYSWRVLMEDIDLLLVQAAHDEPLTLAAKTDSFKRYAEKIRAYAREGGWEKEALYWSEVIEQHADNLFTTESAFSHGIETLVVGLSETETRQLLSTANRAYNTTANQLLISGLITAVHRATGSSHMRLWLEGHGREKIFDDLDVSRTVGWFTSMFPYAAEISDAQDIAAIIVDTKDRMNRIPGKGVGYGMLRHLAARWAAPEPAKQITFNYLGQFDRDLKQRSFAVSSEGCGHPMAIENGTEGLLDIIGLVADQQLQLTLRFNPHRVASGDVSRLADHYTNALREILHHCAGIAEPVATPTDFLYSHLTVAQLRALQSQHGVEDIYALSPVQEGMLFHSLLDAASPAYYQFIRYDVTGTFSPTVLRLALQKLVQQHDALRTKFIYKNLSRPAQVVLSQRNAEFTWFDLSEDTAGEAALKLLAYSEADKARGFDLENDALLRLCVAQLGPTHFRFIWTFHHIVMDGWCAALVSTGFHEAYHALENSLEIVPAPRFRRYMEWLGERDFAGSKDFWKQYFAGFENLTPIKLEALRRGDYSLAHETLVLDRKLTTALRECAAGQQVTLNSILQGIWSVILGRFNNTSDVVFGRIVSGRPAEVQDVGRIVGLFINTIPLRVDVNAHLSFIGMVKALQQDLKAVEPHQYFPLTEIQRQTGFGDGLIDHIFAFENYPLESSGHRAFTNVEVFEQTNYDFNIVVIPGQETQITFKYNADVFEFYFIESIRQSFITLIKQVVDAPHADIGSLALVPARDRDRLLSAFNSAVPQQSKQTFLQMFRQEVERSADSRALIFKDCHVTYAELDRRSNEVAAILGNKGCGAGDIVAVILDKSVEMIISLVGILKTGAAFLPVDPHYPQERIQYVLDDSKRKIVITEQKYQSLVAGSHVVLVETFTGADVPWQAPMITSDDLAYVIYTSGTTGVPNGVMIAHESLAALCGWHNRFYELSPKDISTKYAGFGFDATVWEIFPVLVSGGALYVTAEEIRYNVQAINDCYLKHGVTQSFLPTPVAEQFMTFENPTLKKLLVGGDTLKSIPGKNKYAVYNNYGPTENTVVSTAGKMDPHLEKFHIGKPLDITKGYILSKTTGQLQPLGVPGELCFSGSGLAKGYLGKPELSNQKFVSNPFLSGERMYKTGDMARWLPDGNIDFIGRIDQQVKIRGNRIELGEIEQKLLSEDRVKECAVIVYENRQGHALLVAFYTSRETITADELKLFLSKHLPFYMVPSDFVRLDMLPINQNGKVNKPALVACYQPEEEKVPTAVTNTNVQETIAEVWREVLKIKEVNVTDNFFDLGGTSLDMVYVSEKLHTRLQRDNILMLMFKYPTVSLLAAHLQQISAEDTGTNHAVEAKATSAVHRNRMRQREKRKA